MAKEEQPKRDGEDKLNPEDLDQVSGGAVDAFIKLDSTETFVKSVDTSGSS